MSTSRLVAGHLGYTLTCLLAAVTLVVAGYSNPDIAQRCSISEQTVKHHVSNIFDKLGVSNRLELALFAVNHRLIPGAS